jgi:hypothetical protein
MPYWSGAIAEGYRYSFIGKSSLMTDLMDRIFLDHILSIPWRNIKPA